MRFLLAIILSALMILIPCEALAKPEDKPPKPDITIINEGDTYETTIVQAIGGQGDLDTWLQARSANEWVMNTGIFLPRIMVWQAIKIGKLETRVAELELKIEALENR